MFSCCSWCNMLHYRGKNRSTSRDAGCGDRFHVCLLSRLSSMGKICEIPSHRFRVDQSTEVVAKMLREISLIIAPFTKLRKWPDEIIFLSGIESRVVSCGGSRSDMINAHHHDVSVDHSIYIYANSTLKTRHNCTMPILDLSQVYRKFPCIESTV